MTISGNFQRFQCFNVEADFLENENIFQKAGVPFFSWKHWLRTHHFHTKLQYQKPILRQREWWVQNGPITKIGVSPVTTLFFWKFCFRLRTSYEELIWCTNDLNAHIPSFCKRWRFIWWCFFNMSILKPNLGGGGNFTPCWFSLNNTKTVKAVTLAFCSFQ